MKTLIVHLWITLTLTLALFCIGACIGWVWPQGSFLLHVRHQLFGHWLKNQVWIPKFKKNTDLFLIFPFFLRLLKRSFLSVYWDIYQIMTLWMVFNLLTKRVIVVKQLCYVYIMILLLLLVRAMDRILFCLIYLLLWYYWSWNFVWAIGEVCRNHR